MHDETGDSTYCHNCGTRLIGRDWYVITAWNLARDGKCPECGTSCAGVFEEKPGNWGARRQPLRIGRA